MFWHRSYFLCLAKDLDLFPTRLYFETSAQNGENVIETFDYIFNQLLMMYENGGKRTIEEKVGFNDEQIKAVTQILKGKDNWSKFGLLREG